MSTCVFPGSFDPMTCGHLDLIRRVSAMFDDVIVTVMVNVSKAGCIPYDKRVEMISEACREFQNVRVELWQGLLADYMRLHPGALVVRGVRNTVEFEQENSTAAVNRLLNPGLETILIPASDGFADVSSSVVREIASFGGDYSRFVPECNREKLGKWLKPSKKMN